MHVQKCCLLIYCFFAVFVAVVVPSVGLNSLYLVLADISKTPLDLDCLTRNACCLQNSAECQVSFRYSWKQFSWEVLG